MPSGVLCEHALIMPLASWVAVRRAAASPAAPAGSAGPPGPARAPSRRAPRLGVLGRLGDEDHVYVAGVVELAGPAFPHRDHRQPARRGARRQPGPRDGERGLQRGRGQVSELGHHLIQRVRAGQVPAGQVQQPAPVGGPQRRGRVPAARPCRIGDRCRIAGQRPDRRQHRRAQLPVSRMPERVWPAQHVPVLGVTGQMITECDAGPKDADQALAQGGIRMQGLAQTRVMRQPGETGQGKVGIRCPRQRLDQVHVAIGGVQQESVGDQPLRPGRVSEAHGGQLPGQSRPARDAHPCTLASQATRHVLGSPVLTAGRIRCLPGRASPLIGALGSC